MTDAREGDLARELTTAFEEITKQIDATTKVAIEVGCEPYELRNSDGGFMMAPLLVAKCQILHSLMLIRWTR